MSCAGTLWKTVVETLFPRPGAPLAAEGHREGRAAARAEGVVRGLERDAEQDLEPRDPAFRRHATARLKAESRNCGELGADRPGFGGRKPRGEGVTS